MGKRADTPTNPVDRLEQTFNRRAEGMETRAQSAEQRADAAERRAQAAEERAEDLSGQLEQVRSEATTDREALEAVRGELAEVRQVVVRSGRMGQGTGEDAQARTLGGAFVDSDAFRSYQEGDFRGDSKGTSIDTRALTSADIVVDNPMRPDSIDILHRRPVIRDLMTVISQTEGNAIRYTQEIADWALHTKLAAEAAAAQADVQVKSIAGLDVGSKITLSPGVVGTEEAVEVLSIDQPDEDSSAGVVTLTAPLANTHAVGAELVATEFVFTEEGKYKPMGHFRESEETEAFKVLATGMTESEQILEDSPRLQRKIDQKIPRNLDLSEERQLLYGTGTGKQLSGLVAHPQVQTRNWSDGETGDTQADAIARGANDVWNAELEPNGVIIHRDNFLDIKLKKDNDGRYLYRAEVMGPNGERRIMELPAIVTNAIDKGTALVGAFDMGCTLYDRETTDIQIFRSHKDYAERNLVYIRGERRLCLTVERPQAFVKVVFDAQPV